MGAVPGLRVAVDIGGTFTDSVLVDSSGRVLATAKNATTPDNPADGAFEGVMCVLESADRALADLSGFIHGTTLATNALIERRGAVVGSVTTEGFRDILEIAYERRYDQYDINLDKPDLIVPRRRCFTVSERVLASGVVRRPLDETSVDALVDALDAAGVEAVAVCLLHSYANPAHEERLRELLLARRPELAVSLSSEVSPEAREFERLCTTVANAYVQPFMARYLSHFEARFAAQGLRCPILMMTAGGGMTTLDTASRFPIRLVESGPAGGAILASRVAARVGDQQVLSFDMGGTTAKLCLIDDFRPQRTRKFEIARADRFVSGSGMPVRIPVFEMVEICAGGGSIASVDRLGRLRVGPRSAGSEPGPAAFGKGGQDATVTDADVALGLIEPEQFAEGRIDIDTDIARQALLESVGEALGLRSPHAADAVSQIVDENMANAARMHAVESGKDLGRRTMIAFGGNGPLHATRVARRAGISRILVPCDPGVGSALGFLFAPLSYEVVRSRHVLLDRLDPDGLNRFLDAMTSEAESVVRLGEPIASLRYRRTAFMRYQGQGHEIEVELPARPVEDKDVTGLRNAFELEYSRQFSRPVPCMTIEILNWASHVSTVAAEPSAIPAVVETRFVSPSGTREVLCDVTGKSTSAGVFVRSNLVRGDRLAGPALVVEPQSSTFVSRDFRATVDGDGNLILTREQGR